MELPKRNFGLDLLRFLAIVIVLIHHWAGGFLIKFYPAGLQHWTLLGYLGVEIFFVLSGFLIGSILIKTFLNETDYTPGMIKNFWIRRWYRTLPLYFIILGVFFIFFAVRHYPVPDAWKYLFFLQNFAGYEANSHDFYGVSWSLSIEEWFYLSFPVVLFVANRGLKSVLSKKSMLLTVIFFYIFGMLLSRVAISLTLGGEWKNTFRKAVICREDSIAFGVLVAYVKNQHHALLLKWKGVLAVVGSLMLLFCIIYFLKFISEAYYFDNRDSSFFSKTFYFSLTSLSIALIVPLAFSLAPPPPAINRFITLISKISYSLYLTHLFILSVVYKLLPPSTSIIKTTFGFVLFMAISVFVATLSFKYLEEPFFKLRDKKWKELYKPV